MEVLYNRRRKDRTPDHTLLPKKSNKRKKVQDDQELKTEDTIEQDNLQLTNSAENINNDESTTND